MSNPRIVVRYKPWPLIGVPIGTKRTLSEDWYIYDTVEKRTLTKEEIVNQLNGTTAGQVDYIPDCNYCGDMGLLGADCECATIKTEITEL